MAHPGHALMSAPERGRFSASVVKPKRFVAGAAGRCDRSAQCLSKSRHWAISFFPTLLDRERHRVVTATVQLK